MKYDSPSISFAINEPYMTQAFWDHLKISSPGSLPHAMLAEDSKNKIQGFIKELKDL